MNHERLEQQAMIESQAKLVKTTKASLLAVAKRFLAIFLPIFALIVTVATIIVNEESKDQKTILENSDVFDCNMKKEKIIKDLRFIASDLIFLSAMSEFQKIFEGKELDAAEELAEEFRVFCKNKKIYKQLRFINTAGKEVIRVNYNDGKPYIVPEKELQYKDHRYYFKKAMQFQNGEIYVSAFDLNMERGKIELPLTPVIRFATPVFDNNGQKQGIVVFNYFGVKLLQNLEEKVSSAIHHEKGRVMLLNDKGSWLNAQESGNTWGLLIDGKADQTFAKTYPGVWQKINGSESGQFYGADGTLYTFVTVHPGLEVRNSTRGLDNISGQRLNSAKLKSNYWKVVHYEPPGVMQIGSRKLLGTIVVSTLGVVLAMVCWFFASAAINRKQAEDSLRDSEEQTRLIVESALDAVITIDSKGLVTEWNSQAETILGWPRSEVIGQELSSKIIPIQYRETHERGLKHFLGTGEGPVFNKRLEMSAIHRDGHEFPIELSISKVKKMGESFLFSAFIRDITERKEAEKKIQKAQQAAEAGNRAKGEFLANMSHEIRTPMNGIIGMGGLALGTDLTAEAREYVGMVKMSADSLLGLLNDILDYSKIEAGRLDIEPINFKLRDSLSDMVNTLALRAKQKGVELICHILPEVPDAFVGDPSRLRQIIVNLLGNAIKFTEAGEVVLRVETESQTEDNIGLHFSVIDTGIGIPADKQQIIFEAFSQAEQSTTREYGGTGLGLAISYRLVRLMGGRIWVESEEGKGSKFQFTTHFGLQKGVAVEQTPVDLEKLRDLFVLVVDDNSTNRYMLNEMLINWHMKPTLADGGQVALTTMDRAQNAGKFFDLVLLDAQMPEMDGFTLAKKIRQNPRFAKAKLVMLSSMGRRGDAARCGELNVDAYLTKPIRQSVLLDSIMTVFGKPQGETQPALVTRHSLRENRRHLNILLAEDNIVNQKLATRLLQKRGHSVMIANNGKEVLSILESGSFDIILMDIQMPEMDGYETTATIRLKEKETNKHIPIIAMTAHAMKGDRQLCLDAGMDGYVSKPIKTKELYDVIEGPLTETTGAKSVTEPGTI